MPEPTQARKAAISPVSLETELRQVLAELEMCSHVAAFNYAGKGIRDSEDPGGRRPPGGVDWAEDPERFRRQLKRGRPEQAVLRDARATLVACRRPPAPSGEPEYGTLAWKRWVGRSDLSHGAIATKFNCTRAYIQQVRKWYGANAA
jgi:hypothetical protein